MKYFYLLALLQLALISPIKAQIISTQSQSIKEDGTSPDASAILDIQSDSKGILLPRMSTTDRLAISDPAEGLLVLDTTTKAFYYYKNQTWVTIADASSGDGGTGLWTESGAYIYNNTHSVGIGTDKPTTALDVKGVITATGLKLAADPLEGYILKTDAMGNALWSDPEDVGKWSRNGANHIYTLGDSIGINTDDPLADLHIMGSLRQSTLMLSPQEPFSGDDASIILTEDNDNTYNIAMTYDGGDNRLYVYGKNNDDIAGPHFGINRDNGRVGIGTGVRNPVTELEVVGEITATEYSGDGSGLTNVYADSLVGSMQADTNDILQWNGSEWDKIPYGRYAFHASASVDQTVEDTAYDTLRCNNSSSGENFEYPVGIFDNDIYAFIAPVDGIYFFEASALWEDVADGLRSAIFIRVNNTDEVGSWSMSSIEPDSYFSTNVSTTLELNEGDKVMVRIYNGDTVPRDTFTQSGKYCYFSGYMVFAK